MKGKGTKRQQLFRLSPVKESSMEDFSQQQNTSSDVFASSHLFIVFNYCPLPGVWIAFTSYNFRDGIFGSPFVGLSNFEFLISSGELWTLTKNTILYNLVLFFLEMFSDRNCSYAE